MYGLAPNRQPLCQGVIACGGGGRYFAQIMSISSQPLIKPVTLGSGPRQVTLQHPVILAPMSGVTDLPFRALAKEMGAGMVVSEMIASWAMMRENRKTLRMAEVDGGRRPVRGAAGRLRAGGDGRGGAASPSGWGADLIDINFGCPVKKVAVGQTAGSALMRDEAAGRRDPGSHRPRRGRAGDAEDAHGLGPCQPERPHAGAHRRGMRASAWSPCMAAPASNSTTGVADWDFIAPGEGGGEAARHRQRRHHSPRTMPQRRCAAPAPMA